MVIPEHYRYGGFGVAEVTAVDLEDRIVPYAVKFSDNKSCHYSEHNLKLAYGEPSIEESAKVAGDRLQSVLGFNPKDIAGNKKINFTNIALTALVSQAGPMKDGVAKYEKYNWYDPDKAVDNLAYINAALRHIYLYLAGEDNAEDSGHSHLAHVVTGLSVLIDAQFIDNATDSRIKMPPEALAKFKRLIDCAD